MKFTITRIVAIVLCCNFVAEQPSFGNEDGTKQPQGSSEDRALTDNEPKPISVDSESIFQALMQASRIGIFDRTKEDANGNINESTLVRLPASFNEGHRMAIAKVIAEVAAEGNVFASPGRLMLYYSSAGEIDREVTQLDKDKEEAVANHDYEKAAAFRDQADKLREKQENERLLEPVVRRAVETLKATAEPDFQQLVEARTAELLNSTASQSSNPSKSAPKSHQDKLQPVDHDEESIFNALNDVEQIEYYNNAEPDVRQGRLAVIPYFTDAEYRQIAVVISKTIKDGTIEMLKADYDRRMANTLVVRYEPVAYEESGKYLANVVGALVPAAKQRYAENTANKTQELLGLADSSAKAETDVASLQLKYESHEREAARLATLIRNESRQDRQQLREQLEASVEAAFSARVELHQTRLAKARRDLAKTEARITQREGLRDKIIARRVEELLADEDTSWLGGNDQAGSEQRESTKGSTASNAAQDITEERSTESLQRFNKLFNTTAKVDGEKVELRFPDDVGRGVIVSVGSEFWLPPNQKPEVTKLPLTTLETVDAFMDALPLCALDSLSFEVQRGTARGSMTLPTPQIQIRSAEYVSFLESVLQSSLEDLAESRREDEPLAKSYSDFDVEINKETQNATAKELAQIKVERTTLSAQVAQLKLLQQSADGKKVAIALAKLKDENTPSNVVAEIDRDIPPVQQRVRGKIREIVGNDATISIESVEAALESIAQKDKLLDARYSHISKVRQEAIKREHDHFGHHSQLGDLRRKISRLEKFTKAIQRKIDEADVSTTKTSQSSRTYNGQTDWLEVTQTELNPARLDEAIQAISAMVAHGNDASLAHDAAAAVFRVVRRYNEIEEKQHRELPADPYSHSLSLAIHSIPVDVVLDELKKDLKLHPVSMRLVNLLTRPKYAPGRRPRDSDDRNKQLARAAFENFADGQESVLSFVLQSAETSTGDDQFAAIELFRGWNFSCRGEACVIPCMKAALLSSNTRIKSIAVTTLAFHHPQSADNIPEKLAECLRKEDVPGWQRMLVNATATAANESFDMRPAVSALADLLERFSLADAEEKQPNDVHKTVWLEFDGERTEYRGDIRVVCIEALAAIGHEDALPKLKELADSGSCLAEAAKQAMRQISTSA